MIRLIFSVVLVIGSWVIFTQITNPTYAKIDTLKADAARFDVALTKANELRAERAKLQSKFNLFSEDEKAKLAKFLPESIDNVRLIIDIDRIAAARSLRINNISISSSEAGGEARGSIRYGMAALTFNVNATYDQYLTFLADLEKSLRLTDVVSISFVAGTDTVENSYSTRINTYWIIPDGSGTTKTTTTP